MTKSTPATPKLSNSDFRFISAWVQGVDVRKAWEMYQLHRGPGDLRRIRNTTRLLMDLLAGIGRRHGLPEAMALRRDAARITVTSSTAPMKSSPVAMNSSGSAMTSRPAPTLDQFRDELDDPDYYSEAELVELWQERFGSVARAALDAGPAARPLLTSEDRAFQRRARLVKRQLEALRNLESLAAASPMPEDLVESWLFSSETAKRLRMVGILRLGELMFYIRLHGYRWYRKVPRIGEEGAKRLVAWLRQHEATLGSVSPRAVVPMAKLDVKALLPPPTTGVVPFERLVVPETLSGAEGRNRALADDCSLDGVANDYGAIKAWLSMYAPAVDPVTKDPVGNSNTWRAYRKEAERLLLWAIFERRKALSDLDPLDIAQYRRFLTAPNPLFVGGKGAQRWSEHWRPFEGPLKPRSRIAAETICKTLFSWLVEVGYLKHNPWTQSKGGTKARQLQELRSLSDHQWALVEAWLKSLPTTPANARLQFMFRFAFVSGMRESELANARVSWLYQDTGDRGELVWNMRVIGKGEKPRELPLPERFVAELREHLANKGHDGVFYDVGEENDFPILSALNDPRNPMDGKRIYELMKGALVACADEVQRTDPTAAAQIRRASPHWLRHTHGRMWVEGGGDRGILRDRLGHASIVTTGIYDRSDIRRQRGVVEKLFG
ncbi:MAG: tyrosine-type recombinase/integrase [Burkholderiales bacterium]|nr:tyrosine-type recombinase/integrase [Burkholderiales bacterium]